MLLLCMHIIYISSVEKDFHRFFAGPPLLLCQSKVIGAESWPASADWGPDMCGQSRQHVCPAHSRAQQRASALRSRGLHSQQLSHTKNWVAIFFEGSLLRQSNYPLVKQILKVLNLEIAQRNNYNDIYVVLTVEI